MMVVASIIWGLSYSVQSLISDIGPYTITFFKTIGGLFLLIIALINKAKINKKCLFGGILIGTVAGFACILQQAGLAKTSAANASFITSLYIVFTPIIGLFLGKKINKKTYIGIAFALFGMYLLCIKDGLKLATGDLLVLVCAFLFALQIIFIDKYISDVDAIAFTAIQQITACFISGTLMLFMEGFNFNVVIKVWPSLLYLMFLSGALAQLIQNRFQRDLNPSLASLLMSFESVFGALFGWLILNQALSFKEIIGCILIFIGVILAE